MEIWKYSVEIPRAGGGLVVNGCSDMHDIPILSQLKEFKAIFLRKIFPYHRNFSPKLIKVPVVLFDTLE